MIEHCVSDRSDELINGQVIEGPPVSPDQAVLIRILHDVLTDLINEYNTHKSKDEQVVVFKCDPIELTTNTQVNPDILLLKMDQDAPQINASYYRRNPTASDALSLIEVGSATSYQNKTAKLAIYASAGVPEVILFDIQDKGAIKVTVYRTPVNGRYTKKLDNVTGEVTPERIPGLSITLEDVLIPEAGWSIGTFKNP